MTTKQQEFINTLINKKQLTGELLEDTVFNAFRNGFDISSFQASILIKMLLSCDDKQVKAAQPRAEKVSKAKVMKDLIAVVVEGKELKVQVSKSGIVRHWNGESYEDLARVNELINNSEYGLVFRGE